MDTIKKFSGGIYVLIVCIGAYFINEFFSKWIALEVVSYAIFLGILVANVIKIPKEAYRGISWISKHILHLGIVLLGFTLSFDFFSKEGAYSVVFLAVYIPMIIAISIFLGKKMSISTTSAALIGVGSSICGASAMVSVAPAIGAEDKDTILSVSIINALGAIGVLLYPLLGGLLHFSQTQFGFFSGIGLQGVAHALGAAFGYGDLSGEVATGIKMIRVLFLVPVSLVLANVFSKEASAKVPRYLYFFIASVLVNALGVLPSEVTFILSKSSKIAILFAMAALGLKVKLSDFKEGGLQSFLHASILFVGITILAASISYYIIG